MPQLTYLSDGNRRIDTDSERTVLEASLAHGIPHTHICGGHARCSTCRVLIVDGLDHCTPRTEAEARLAALRRFSPEVRLACQTRITGDVSLRRLVLDDEDLSLVDRELSPNEVRGAAEERTLAVLFADIRHFTAATECLPPYDVLHLLNRYYQRLGPIVQAHRGLIDNFMGDGLMALFGLYQPATAVQDAVHAALAMQEAVAEMRPYMQAQFHFELEIGIGIHVGDVVWGAVGVGERRRLTAIGDTVNVASRIEAENKIAGTQLLLSAAAYAQVREKVRIGRELTTALKGKAVPLTLYEVLGLAAD